MGILGYFRPRALKQRRHDKRVRQAEVVKKIRESNLSEATKAREIEKYRQKLGAKTRGRYR